MRLPFGELLHFDQVYAIETAAYHNLKLLQTLTEEFLDIFRRSNIVFPPAAFANKAGIFQSIQREQKAQFKSQTHHFFLRKTNEIRYCLLRLNPGSLEPIPGAPGIPWESLSCTKHIAYFCWQHPKTTNFALF